MKIGILGTRGIPNNHGGFEQFAEYLSQFLAKKGHEVFVYNSHTHPYQKSIWNAVNIIHQKDPEDKIGTVGQFFYDLNCIRDSRKRDFDIILQLGYTSSSIWGWYLPKNAVIVTNMDGLEWKRAKYNRLVKKFLKFAEKIAIKTSDFLIADSLGIQSYLKREYNLTTKFIAYGADLFSDDDEELLLKYNVTKGSYNILVARLEPENNIETILDGKVKSSDQLPFLVVGKHNTKYGAYLKEKFKDNLEIKFIGAVYNTNHLNNLRFYSNLYFHGHSVGGTNPSLLEAMASNTLIIAHDNIFNRSILESDAFYFNSSKEVTEFLILEKNNHLDLIEKNKVKIMDFYSWDKINRDYENYLIDCFNIKKPI